MRYHEKYNGTVVAKSSGKLIATITADHPMWAKYLAAKDAGNLGEPIPAPAPHVRTVEEARAEKIAEVKAKTAELFAAGVHATIRGKEYLFDVGGGERSLVSWVGFGVTATDGLVSIIPAEGMPQCTTKDGQLIDVTPAEGKALFYALMGGYKAITGPESQLVASVEALEDIAEIDAIEDPR